MNATQEYQENLENWHNREEQRLLREIRWHWRHRHQMHPLYLRSTVRQMLRHDVQLLRAMRKARKQRVADYARREWEETLCRITFGNRYLICATAP